MARTILATITLLLCLLGSACADDGIKSLTEEVAARGWIVFSAKTDKGDWDLFLMRPDGSQKRNLTNTPSYSEGGARFSRDGRLLLYYRMPVGTAMDNNKYGLYDLVLVHTDGSQTEVWGKKYPWACWGPTSDQLACLLPKGIQIIDVKTRKEISRLSRQGMVQQLGWSPNGQWFTGTANGLGVAWCVGALNIETKKIQPVTETDRYNCTPDWWPDSHAIIYSRGIVPEGKGMAQLWQGFIDGREPRLLVGEDDRHLYGGYVSPDGQYLLFTRSQKDLGEVDIAKTTMAICPVKDTPILMGSGDCEGMRSRYPDAPDGPILALECGWEPDWTFAEVK